MGRNEQAGAASSGVTQGVEWGEQLLALGRLSFLASFCPLHRSYTGAALARVFIPAINNDCVRFFENETGQTCAALIWARLSDAVATRMLEKRIPPDSSEWGSGSSLWFIDILAPFDHGRIVARHIARNPPVEPFQFARLDRDGRVRKLVRADARAQGGRIRVRFSAPGTV